MGGGGGGEEGGEGTEGQTDREKEREREREGRSAYDCLLLSVYLCSCVHACMTERDGEKLT